MKEEEILGKSLVIVVSAHPFMRKRGGFIQSMSHHYTVQLEACDYARCQVFCHVALRKFLTLILRPICEFITHANQMIGLFRRGQGRWVGVCPASRGQPAW